jgi:hypothetical protein
MGLLFLLEIPAEQSLRMLSIADVNRRAHKRQRHKDVLGQATTIRGEVRFGLFSPPPVRLSPGFSSSTR